MIGHGTISAAAVRVRDHGLMRSSSTRIMHTPQCPLSYVHKTTLGEWYPMKWNEVTFNFSARPTQSTYAGGAYPSQYTDTLLRHACHHICLKEGDVVQVANSPRAQFSPNNGSWSALMTNRCTTTTPPTVRVTGSCAHGMWRA